MSAVTERTVDEAGMSSTADAAIDVVGMSAGYGKTLIIRDLSLQVPRGAVYGLTGPSGSGKTTLLRVLATLHPPASGTIRLDGMDPGENLAGVRARIGYLPDRFGVYDALTTGEYLDFYAALFGVSGRRRRQSTEELLELFGLTDMRDMQVRTLTRGSRQQLGMARCLVHDPAVLLLDEPAAGMDPEARLELREILTELARLGKSVLLVSTLLSELDGICTHLGILKEGRLVTQGDIADVAPDGESLEDAFRRVTGQDATV